MANHLFAEARLYVETKREITARIVTVFLFSHRVYGVVFCVRVFI